MPRIKAAALVLLIAGFCPASGPSTSPASVTNAFDAYRAMWRAHGEPSTSADLNTPRITDERNSALLLKRAAAAIDKDKSSPRSSALEWTETLPYPPEWHRIAKESVLANGRSLELARSARQ